MIFKLLTEYHLEFLSLKGGCTGLPVSLQMSNYATLLEITCSGSYFTGGKPRNYHEIVLT